MSVVIGYATFKSAKEAKKICAYLLKNKLIACANIFSSHTALYEWKNKMITTQEVAVIFKTQKKHTKILTQEIEKLHSYEVPCVIFWPLTQGSKKFLRWIQTQTEK